SQLFDAVWQHLAIFNPFREISIELRTHPSLTFIIKQPIIHDSQCCILFMDTMLASLFHTLKK
ncbi:MAG: hypothetical protein ACTHYX_03725, partial [Psychrobacter sp.]